MTFIDKAIGFFSPERELKRIRVRLAVNEMRKYDAASSGRRTKGWQSLSSSANTENGPALVALRNRSRDLVRNNPYAKKAIDVITTNTVGTGIRLTINAKDETAQKKYEEVWFGWAESTQCDFTGMLNFYGMQALVMRTIAESGSCLIRKRVVNNTNLKVAFQMQVLEPEYLATEADKPSLPDGGYIMQGVEFDKNGSRVAYHIHERHPNEQFQVKYNRIPAADVMHVYKIDRPGQISGVPFGTSAALKLHDFADYEDAQLMRQKVAACFAAFIQDQSPDAINGTGAAASTLPERVEPGMIEHLPAGKTVTFGTPPAAEGYESYAKKILQGVASGYGITYEALTGDLGNVNFSSGRMGWLEFHKMVEDWQYNMMIPRFCAVVWEWFVAGAKIGSALPGKEVTAEWTAPRREMIDPVKESKGLSLQIRNGLTSWSETIRSLGSDPKKLAKEISEDFKLFENLSLILDCDPRNKIVDTSSKAE